MLYDLIDAEGKVLRKAFKLRPYTPLLEEGQMWIESTPEPAPVVIPTIVTRYQGMCALYQMSLLTDIETYMATAEPLEQLAWKEFSEFNRNSVLLEKLAVLFELTEAQIDDIFLFAATITT